MHLFGRSAAAMSYAGKRVRRVEDARLLTGHGTFVDDVTRPGMLHACFVRSTHAHARIVRIDATAALALPGVCAVFLAADLNPDVREQWHSQLGPLCPETPRPPLANDEVRYVGDPVAMVIAQDRYVAEDACDLVEVDYEPLPAIVDYEQAENSDTLVFPEKGTNLIHHDQGIPFADLDEAYASAAFVVSETVRQQAYAAVPMETRGLVVEHEPASGELTIWAATQAPSEVRMFCSRLLGVPEHRVRVISRDTGGGFGQKILVQREDMCLMLAARKLPAAVKWVEDRHENLIGAGWSRHEHGTVRMAFDGDGKILATDVDFVSDCGAYPTPWPAMSAALVGALFPGPYRIPKATFSAKSVWTHTAGRSGYRGPWQYETLAREVVLDIAARRMGTDPIEVRRANLLSADDLPFTNPNELSYSHVTPLETFEHALEIFGYEDFRRQQAEARGDGRYLGVGVSNYVEPTTAGFGIFATETATIRIEPSGLVSVYTSGGSAGNSLETTVVQLTADALGVDMAHVVSVQGDTAVASMGAGTGGSRSGSMLAGVIGETAVILRERIVALGAHLLEVDAGDAELADGRVSVRGTGVGVTLAEIAAKAYFDAPSLPVELRFGLEVTHRYATPHAFNWANASHVCTCEVDIATGKVTLLRYIVAEDCGPMINPNIVEGQVSGGTVQGIGGALLENLVYDEAGNPMTTTFLDYLLPAASDVPVIEYGHVVTSAPGPGGYKGVGEGGAIGAPPAVVNAVADALSPFGIVLDRLPLDPARLVDALAATH